MNDTVPRLSRWVSPWRWAESQVTIYFLPTSRHRMVASSCQDAFENLVWHSTIMWLKCSWIVANIHLRIQGWIQPAWFWGQFQYYLVVKSGGVTRRARGAQFPGHQVTMGAPNHCRSAQWLRKCRKVPTMWQILSSMQNICFQKTSVLNIGAPNLLLTLGAI